MSSDNVLTPKQHPPKPFPRWWALAVGIAGAAAAALELADARGAVQVALQLVAAIATARLAGWFEQRLYERLSGVSAFGRVMIHASLILAGLIIGGTASAVLGLIPFLNRTTFAALPVIFGMYVGFASMGTLLIVLIDVVISSVISTFRMRVALAAMSLVFAVMSVCLVIAALGTELTKSLGAQELKLQVTPGSDFTRDDLVRWLSNPTLSVAIVFGLALLFLLPALISASVKFADVVMDRIRPLETAFTRVREGDREVRLEVGGSTEFKRLAERFNEMVERLGLAERMERAFGVYVSGHVLEKIRSQHGEAILPATLKDATVFFADIRGFTSASEKLPPDAVVAFLNRYFERAVAVIQEHEGYLNKFIGDAIVVVFNGPLDQPDHAERAVKCAIALQRKVAEMNARGEFPEIGTLQIGVGVSTGAMTCGNVGSARQMEYTVIGDTVNLAARLTSAAGPGEVLISEETAKQLPASYGAVPLPAIKVKGKQIEVTPSRVPVAVTAADPRTRSVTG